MRRGADVIPLSDEKRSRVASSCTQHEGGLISSTERDIDKYHLYNFIENLFKINMSEDVLVDVIIHDDEPDSSKVTVVGRPKLLGKFY